MSHSSTNIFSWVFVILLSCLSVSCDKPDKQNLGNGYFLLTDLETPGNSKIIHGNESVSEDVILGEIVDYDVDPDFIVVHRLVTEKARLLFDESPLWKKQLRDLDQYWIIEKKYDGIHGPLSKAEYMLKRKELNISPGVKIRK